MAKPPRLALALVDRFLPDSEAFIGDLVEDYEQHQSSLRLWREVAAVLVPAVMRRAPEPRPLRLVHRDPSVLALERMRARQMQPPRTINLSAGPVNGISGAMLVVIVVFISAVAVPVWWALLFAVIGGTFLGVVGIALNRRRINRQPQVDVDGSLLLRTPMPNQEPSASSRRG